MYLATVMRRASREVRDVARAGTPTHSRLRDQLVALLVATIGVNLICAVLALLFEQHEKQTQVKSFGSALFWTSTQLVTVSSSVQNPISTAGRILDVGMEIYAITVVASLTGALGSFMIRRAHERDRAAEQAHTLPEV